MSGTKQTVDIREAYKVDEAYEKSAAEFARLVSVLRNASDRDFGFDPNAARTWAEVAIVGEALRKIRQVAIFVGPVGE